MEREQAAILAKIVHEVHPTTSWAQTTEEKLRALKWDRKMKRRARRRDAERRAKTSGANVTGRVVREEIILRDKSICHICGKKCEPGEIHLDHVIPLAKGGVHGPENVKVACADCNIAKGANLPE